MDIAIPIFDELTALDAVGPYEVLSRLPDARVSFVATELGPKRTENGMLALVADRSLAELPEPDVLAAAGLLDGREATTHWLQTELLKPYGALPVSRRVVRSGKIVA